MLCKRFKRPRRTFCVENLDNGINLGANVRRNGVRGHYSPLPPGDGVQEMVEFRDFCEVRYGKGAAKALEMWLFGGHTRAESAAEGGLSPAGLSRVRERLREEWK